MAHAPVDDTEHAPDVRPLKNPDKGKQIQELYLSINAKLREEVQVVYGIS